MSRFKYLFLQNYLLFALCTHISVISEDNQEAQLKFHGDESIFRISAKGSQSQISYLDKTILLYDQQEITTDIDIVLKNDLGINFEQKLIYNEIDQPIIWFVDNFDKEVEGWNDLRTSVCGTSTDYFLGGPCFFSNKPIMKKYEGIPKHTALMVSFNFHFIDDWEGEIATLKLDSEVVWQQDYNWCEKVMPWMCYKFGINVCGNQIPDQFAQFQNIVIEHTKSDLFMEFVTTLGAKDACQASWGIDNVSIYLL